MILSCPNCSTRYLLSSASIGVDGRDVRCAKCNHQWFQEPDPDLVDNLPAEETEPSDAFDDQIDQRLEDIKHALQEEDDDESPASQEEPPVGVSFDDIDDGLSTGSEEDIPESVKPQHSNVPAYAEDVRRRRPSLQARITGYATAAMLFVCLLLAGLIFKTQAISAWPPVTAIYELAGFPVTLKGEELVMESLSATILKDDQGQESLVIKGRVINLTDKPIDVPQMLAVLRSTNGEDGESWLIDAPVDIIEPGASFAFTSDYPEVPRGVGSVNLTFVPTLIGTSPAQVSS